MAAPPPPPTQMDRKVERGRRRGEAIATNFLAGKELPWHGAGERRRRRRGRFFRWLFKGDELNMTVVSVMAWGRRRRGRRKVVLSPQTARRQLAAGGGGGVFRTVVYSCCGCSVMRSWKRQPLCKRTSYGFFHILLLFCHKESKKKGKRKGAIKSKIAPVIPIK